MVNLVVILTAVKLLDERYLQPKMIFYCSSHFKPEFVVAGAGFLKNPQMHCKL